MDEKSLIPYYLHFSSKKRRYSCLQIIHGNLRLVSPNRVTPSKYLRRVKPSKATELSVVFFVRLTFRVECLKCKVNYIKPFFKKNRPSRGNGTASNDCLPYEKGKNSLFSAFHSIYLIRPLTISFSNDCCCVILCLCKSNMDTV